MSLLHATPWRASVGTLSDPRDGSLESWPSLQPSIYALTESSTTKPLSAPVSTFGKSPSSCVTPSVPITCTDAWICGPVSNSESVTLASVQSYGEMTAPDRAVSMQNLVNTATQPTGVVTTPVSPDSSCLTDQTKPDGDDLKVSHETVCWTLDSSAGGGSCTRACKTTMSIPKNGQSNQCSRLTTSDTQNKSGQTADIPTALLSVQTPDETTQKRVGRSGKSSVESKDISSHLGVGDTNDDDEDWELINEELVYADCHGVIEPDLLRPNAPLTFVDLDSKSPIVQLGTAVFEGRYEDTIGTLVFFNKKDCRISGKDQTESRALGNPNSSLQSTAPRLDPIMSTKCLRLDRVFLKPKNKSDMQTSTTTTVTAAAATDDDDQ